MRVILFLNNWGGWQVAKWLRQQHEEIVGLVVQPEGDRKFGNHILSSVNLPADRVWIAPELTMSETATRIRELTPDIGISAFFGYLLKPEIFEIPRHGCINLHAAYLPWNRGWHTNIWPIIDGSPAGVTIHYIEAGADTGDIIAQRVVPVEATDTGGSLHERITREVVALFQETWPLIKQGKHTRRPQDHALATKHRRADLTPLDFIDLDKNYRAGDLLNILRARTYPPYPSAYFVQGSRRIHVRVQVVREEEIDPGGIPPWMQRDLESA